MSELTESQIKEHDIDWYCLIEGKPTHIASMGGTIPPLFRNRENLRRMQDIVAHMTIFTEAKLNLDNIKSQTADGYDYLEDEMIRETIENANRNYPGFVYLSKYDLPIRLFASSFVEKARRGFYSYARREVAEGNEYILIAEPDRPYEDVEHQLDLLECELHDNGTVMIIK